MPTNWGNIGVVEGKSCAGAANGRCHLCHDAVLYREAIELHLKALVSEGNNFLRTKVDPISLYKTDSLRWLAQIVCQIIRAVEWENEFRCEGVSDLTEFSAVVNDLERLDPVKCAVMSARIGVLGTPPPPMQKVNAVEFACRMDALIDLLDSAADALAATWEMMAGGAEGGAGSGHTIH